MTVKLPTDYSHFIFTSRYARWNELEKRREAWPETVKRYFDFMEKHLEENNGYKLKKSLRKELEAAVLNLDVLPSMRCLATAGPALDRCNVAGYNCSYLPLDSPRSFDELFYILLCGTGVGYSVERQYINQLPTVSEHFEKSNTVITVEDSKSGWARSLKELIALLYQGQIPTWDTSKVRPKGSRLKTFGGRASGPGPLIELFKWTVSLFQSASGRKLNSIECHDLCCKIASTVVVGGVRRSAMISLSNLSDPRMRDAKTGEWFRLHPDRSFANNSVVYTEKPDMGIFMQEWKALYDSHSGERGIFNRVASQKQAAKNGRRDVNYEWGTNPCLHPDTEIETVHGRVKIKDIKAGTYVYCMDQQTQKLTIKRASAAWVSKHNTETVIVKVASGKELICTPDHKIYVENRGWVQARDLKKKDRVVHLVRNTRGAAYAGVKLTTQDKRDFVMEHRLIWKAVYGEIPHGYDIHHRDGNTYNNSIDNLECLPHEVHSRLTATEQPNNHMVHGYHGKGQTGWGYISPSTSRHGAKVRVPMPEHLKSNLHQYATVESVTPGPVTDVYDMMVEGEHNFIANFIVVHNCSEIILRPYQFCNLTECVVRADDTLDALKNKVRLATILGTFQSTLTNFKYLRKVWKNNTEEERLLGVSLTGICDNPLMYAGEGLQERLNELKQVAIDTNKQFADDLDIPVSAAITCVKPSGTVSQLVNAASGIHPRHSQYYIRRVRGDSNDPLAAFLKDCGIPTEPCAYKPDSTVVFSWPIKGPADGLARKDLNAIAQLELWKTYQEYWCEHKPSITVYVKDKEWMEVGAWVYANFDTVSGISFLPYDGGAYVQAPYTEVSEEEYNELAQKMPKDIPWDKLKEYEKEDGTVASQEFACTGGVCELVDIVK